MILTYTYKQEANNKHDDNCNNNNNNNRHFLRLEKIRSDELEFRLVSSNFEKDMVGAPVRRPV